VGGGIVYAAGPYAQLEEKRHQQETTH